MSYKTLKLVLFVGISCIVVASLLAGCKKDETQTEQTGQLSVQMTDAPGDYAKVNVDIQSVLVHYASSDTWVELKCKSGIYNLLDFQNEVAVLITDTATLHTGRINQIRLVLGSNNSIVLNDSTRFELTIPSGEQSGIKINVDADVLANLHTQLLIDFDAALSVQVTGNGKYMMQPVIKVKRITNT